MPAAALCIVLSLLSEVADSRLCPSKMQLDHSASYMGCPRHECEFIGIDEAVGADKACSAWSQHQNHVARKARAGQDACIMHA